MSTKPKVTIDKLSITLGSKKLELTLEEARELKKILNDTLEPTVTYNPPAIIERHYDRYPAIPQWHTDPVWARPTITCSTQSGLEAR